MGHVPAFANQDKTLCGLQLGRAGPISNSRRGEGVTPFTVQLRMQRLWPKTEGRFVPEVMSENCFASSNWFCAICVNYYERSDCTEGWPKSLPLMDQKASRHLREKCDITLGLCDRVRFKSNWALDV